jgi:hypothetical protein
MIGSTTANINRNDAGVAFSCGGHGGHAFSYTLPPALRTGTNRSIYAYAINVGTGSNVLLSNSPKTINCPLPTPPAVSAVCSADGRNLTVNWTNASGYDRIFFRTAPSSNGNDHSLFDDNAQGNTKTVSITPGVQYNYWIHTNNGGYPSAAIG